MLRRDRVIAALELRQPDRLPLGEMVITGGFVRTFLAARGAGLRPEDVARRAASVSVSAPEHAQVVQALDLDLICLPFAQRGSPDRAVLIPDAANLPPPDSFHLPEATFWTSQTDLFVFALLDGPFSQGVSALGFTEFLTLLARDRLAAARFLASATERGRALIQAAARLGLHGIVLADDVAYDRGPFISPGLLRDLVAPTWRLLAGEAAGLGLKAVFHSDGYVMDIIPGLIEAGFAGVHSLQASSGMDIGRVKERYGRDICLWGNLDLDLLTRGTPLEVRRVAVETIRAAAPGGGYVFGTSGGLVEGLSVTNVVEAYRVAREGSNPGS
jgi:uroporphyrinogen decarboxylase